jgi:hypothetical protein
MATRTTFMDSLLNTYRNKQGELHYAEAKRVMHANDARLKAYQETPEWLAFRDMATKMMGATWTAGQLRFMNSDNVRFHDQDFAATIGIADPPVRYSNPKLDTLIMGALATTKIKFWDGWFPPVDVYLDAVAAATTNEEVDAAVMALVRAL